MDGKNLNKRVLIIQRRDIKNPFHGGGVNVLFLIAKQLIENGYDVTWVSSNFNHSKSKEIINGINHIRGWPNFCFFFYLFFRFYPKNKDFDLIIEGMTPIPFFSPYFYKKTTILPIVYHLAKNSIFTETSKYGFFGFLIGIPILILENTIPFIYRKYNFLTFSHITKKELLSWGVDEKKIIVAQEGINLDLHKKLFNKSLFPHLLYVGRLTKSKGVQYGIYLIKNLILEYPDIQFSIVGTGPYREKLVKIVKNLNLEKNIIFHGYVSEDNKIELLNKAHILLMLSEKEGWATPVTEANACGTIAIGFNRPGIKETIIHEKTGYLVSYGDIKKLEYYVKKILNDSKHRNEMEFYASRLSTKYSWKNTINSINNSIYRIMG